MTNDNYSNNCCLLPFESSDITEKYINWLNDPVVTKYSNQNYVHADFNSCSEYLKSFLGTDNLFLKIVTDSPEAFIGTITAYVDKHHGLADMGILIGNRDFWGKGFGLSAWNQMKELLFKELGCRKITAGTVTANIAMLNIMKKSGMHLEATRPKHLIFNKKIYDAVYYYQLK
tara:strand:- start:44 stop:562 length:519 start_codon:yes stop_codon:yes gene_type:complete